MGCLLPGSRFLPGASLGARPRLYTASRSSLCQRFPRELSRPLTCLCQTPDPKVFSRTSSPLARLPSLPHASLPPDLTVATFIQHEAKWRLTVQGPLSLTVVFTLVPCRGCTEARTPVGSFSTSEARVADFTLVQFLSRATRPPAKRTTHGLPPFPATSQDQLQCRGLHPAD